MSTSKFISLFGWITLSVLLVLSMHYYLERVALLDSAYQIFLMINDGRVEVMTNRWPVVIFRWLPYVALQCNASLALILMLHSISYPLYQAIIFFLLFQVLKKPKFALLWILSICAMISETFYWCPSDLQQGLGLVLLLHAMFESKRPSKKVIRLGIIGILVVMILFIHPLLLFPLGFISGYQFLDGRKNKMHYVYLTLAFVSAWLIKAKWISNWYDIAKQEEFAQHFQTYKSAIWSIPTHAAFGSELVYKYHFLLLFLFISAFLLVRSKKWLSLLLLLGSSLIYILIVHLSNPIPEFPFYREAAYIPLFIFAGYPLLQLISLDPKSIRIGLIAIVLMSFIRIYLTGHQYRQRVEWIQKTVMQTDCDKRLIESSELPSQIIKMDWGLPYESLLISQVTLRNSKTIYPVTDSEDINQLLEQKDRFHHRFREMKINELHPKYFNLDNPDYCR